MESTGSSSVFSCSTVEHPDPQEEATGSVDPLEQMLLQTAQARTLEVAIGIGLMKVMCICNSASPDMHTRMGLKVSCSHFHRVS
jgi:hypothetical protein